MQRSSHSHKMPEDHCPFCGRDLDRVSGIDHKDNPKPGDCTICIYCASFLTINSDFTLQEMTEEEIGELDDKVRQMLIHARKIIKSLNE